MSLQVVRLFALVHNLEESSITYLKMVISHSHECLGQARITENNADAQIIAVIAVQVLEIFWFPRCANHKQNREIKNIVQIILVQKLSFEPMTSHWGDNTIANCAKEEYQRLRIACPICNQHVPIMSSFIIFLVFFCGRHQF